MTQLRFIQVKDGDSLPPIICHRCVYKLDVLHNFREVSHKSDVILKQYLDYAKQLSSHDDQVVIKYIFLNAMDKEILELIDIDQIVQYESHHFPVKRIRI